MNAKASEARAWYTHSISELQVAMSRGETSSEDITRHFIDRIEKYDSKINAVLMINPDAMAQAKALDLERDSGKVRGPLHGIPVLLKDNIDTNDKMPTTAGSVLLQDHFPGRDAFVVQQLRQAGAVILGKTNLSEWANFRSEQASSGWSSVGGQTRNPYDPRRSPCGSSSGSAAAVAAGLAPAAIGTETSGSIICPAQINNIVGIKPVVGSVSRTGIVPISNSQDTAGPMANSVADAVQLLNTMMGKDESDAASFEQASFSEGAVDLKGKRIGLVTNMMGYLPQVDDLTRTAAELLGRHGADIKDCKIKNRSKASGFAYEIMQYEFKAGINQYLQDTNARHQTLTALIEANAAMKDVALQYFGQDIFIKSNARGSLTNQAYLRAKAQARQLSGPEGIDAALAECSADLLIAPSGGPAWMIDPINGDHYLGGSAGPAASAGYPHITVPMGFVSGMPVGLSFFGGRDSTQLLIDAATSFEALTEHRQLPEDFVH